jgi:hypothetical protein
VTWRAHPVGTPRLVFVLLLALAAAAGFMLLAALAKHLFGSRDTPRNRPEDFRSAWESLADHLRIWQNWQAHNDNALQDPHLQELYCDHRCSALEASARVRDDFRRFLEETSGWDLRAPLPVEMSPSEVAHEEIQGA